MASSSSGAPPGGGASDNGAAASAAAKLAAASATTAAAKTGDCDDGASTTGAAAPEDGGVCDNHHHRHHYTSTHQDALELELSVVEAVLKRNRCSHGRTKYHQRLSMAFRCVVSGRKGGGSDSGKSRKRRRGDMGNEGEKKDPSPPPLLPPLSLLDLWREAELLEAELAERRDSERRKRKRREVFWDVREAKDDSKRLEKDMELYRRRLLRLASTLFTKLPESLSRLRRAADALFAEVARGFFLPLCTVSVAAASRIRALLLQMAEQLASSTLPALRQLYEDAFLLPSPGGAAKEKKKKRGASCGDDSGPQLWTSQQLLQFQAFLHDERKRERPPDPQKATSQQRTERALTELGLTATAMPLSPPRGYAASRGASNSSGAARRGEAGAASSDLSSVETAEGGKAACATGEGKSSGGNDEGPPAAGADRVGVGGDDDDDDVGESIAPAAMNEQSAADEIEEGHAAAAAAGRGGRHHELDTNMALVEAMRSNKRKKEKKDKKAKKKKRKKEKDGAGQGDFFDELFGK